MLTEEGRIPGHRGNQATCKWALVCVIILSANSHISICGVKHKATCDTSYIPLQEGYGRWELFRQKGLDLYAAHRNNALKR